VSGRSIANIAVSVLNGVLVVFVNLGKICDFCNSNIPEGKKSIV